MRSFQGITDAVTAFKACRGKVTAKDAKTGEEAVVEAVKVLPGHRALLSIRYKDGKDRRFEADYVGGPNGLGTYFNIKVNRPASNDCEPTSIEILDNGQEDYEVCAHGSGRWEPALALTLVNEGAEERNAPIIAAWEAEQKRQQDELQRKNRQKHERQEAERQAQLKTRKAEITAQLDGKRVTGVEIAACAADYLESLTLTFSDGTTVKIRARLDNSLNIE